MRNHRVITVFLISFLMSKTTYAQNVPVGFSFIQPNEIYTSARPSLGGQINKVTTYIPRIRITDPAIVANNSIVNVTKIISYVDGQGRQIQSVNVQSSPLGKDVVSYSRFDEYGRPSKSYLPFVSQASDGNFKFDADVEQKLYYETFSLNSEQYNGEKIFYGKSFYENSPLQRPIKSEAPGNSWAGLGRGVAIDYSYNTATDNVKLFYIDGNQVRAIPQQQGYFLPSSLTKLTTTDEKNAKVIEFKNKSDQVVLKKVQSAEGSNEEWLETYYVYDDYGLLRFVIPPLASEALSNGASLSTIKNELCFSYDYDFKNRMIIKNVPGAGETLIVYDTRNRVVLSQTSLLRDIQKWTYTLYDNNNRVIETGLYSSSQSQTYLATLASNGGFLFENATSNDFNMLSQSTYDEDLYNPQFDAANVATLVNGNNVGAEDVVPVKLNYGKLITSFTGTISNNSIPSLPESKKFFYDEKSRTIQIHYQLQEKFTALQTVKYDFTGNVIGDYLQQNQHYVNINTEVRTRTDYDASNRPLASFIQVYPDAEKENVNFQYDGLGQLKNKTLAPYLNQGQGVEKLRYKYNIRGWLESINGDYCDNVNQTNWFGQKLAYDNGFSQQLYDGNISGTEWKTRGSGVTRAYGFEYDLANRLKKADFNQQNGGSWDKSAGIDFSVPTLNYDKNGNIKAMQQIGWKPQGSVMIDDLVYSYTPNTNKLLGVVDNANNFQSTLGDFKYDPSTKQSQDYLYDLNGNMTKDLNKGISTPIDYNYLNLPSVIQVGTKGSIEYQYLADGRKLDKKVTDNTISPSTITTTTYYNGIVYENDVLQYLPQAEGRVRLKNNAYVFDYFVKDHLGNIRVVLTDEQQVDTYPAATMEVNAAAVEEAIYSQIVETRVAVPAGYPANTPSGNERVAKLQTNTAMGSIDVASAPSVSVGPGIMIKVMAGDKFDYSVNSWWKAPSKGGGSTESPNGTNIFSQLLLVISGALSNQPGVKGNTAPAIAQDPGLTNGINQFLNNQAPTVSQYPKAYVNYILLDENFKFVSQSSGYKQIEGSEVYSTLYDIDLPVTKSGYLYVYVSNSSSIPVYFDNLSLVHHRGPLVEETHYYPFGLVMSGISSKAAGIIQNKEKTFQGQLFDNDLGLDWVQFKWRNHDPQIGRFIEIDPLSEEYVHNSTYAFSENKVTTHVELEGLEAVRFDGSKYSNRGESTQIRITALPMNAVVSKPTPAATITVSKGTQAGVKVAGVGLDVNFGSKEILKVSDVAPGSNTANKSSIKKGIGVGVGIVNASKEISTTTVAGTDKYNNPTETVFSEVNQNLSIGIKKTPISVGVDRTWTFEQTSPYYQPFETSDTGLQPTGGLSKSPGGSGATKNGTEFSFSLYYKLELKVDFKQVLINIFDSFNKGGN